MNTEQVKIKEKRGKYLPFTHIEQTIFSTAVESDIKEGFHEYLSFSIFK
jgi:hypothetical protein